MAFPMLQVTSLGGERGLEEAEEGRSGAAGLPPVTGDTPAVPRVVYLIGEAAKRSRSAGVLGCGRVAPFTQVASSSRPSSGQRPRPRSSPRLGHRYARVTPYPAEGQSRPEVSHAGQVTEGGTSLLPRLRRHDLTACLRGEEDALSSSGPRPSSPPVMCSPCAGKGHQWSGRYSVPTISIGPHSSSSSSTSSTSHHAKGSSHDEECTDIINLENNKYVTERIHNLVSAFSQRASRVKAHITQPLTPSTDLSEGADDGQNKAGETRQPLDSLDDEGSATKGSSEPVPVGLGGRQAWLCRHLHLLSSILAFPQALEPQSRLYICWLLVVSISYVYNACVIPLRSVFTHYQTEDNLAWWLTADCLADLIYIGDIVVFKSRVMYLDNGFWISSSSLMRRHYLKTVKFRYDLVSLLPLELLYFKFGPISVFRLPRLFKIHTFWEFFNRLDSVLSSPHAVRVIRTVLYMLFLIHLNTCAYYGFSKYEGIGSNLWVFQGDGNAYIRCFYFATKTATSIGKNPKPENKEEYLFMTCSWLMGVFVFALLIGQIRDIVATATRNQNEYRRVMDHTQAYLHRLNLPASLQERVRLWFAYTWQSQKTLNEMKWLESLPKKMRTDIAINVHIQTLSKVQLFQDCDKALLRDLVLKLQPVLYLPGDFVCKKGEVGKEMYIVQSGQVLVMGGDKVLATLGEGSVFGEISLLALAGGNRRTANVRSRGFSSLFVLSKADLQATIKDYPEAQEILKKKAKKLIKQNEERERQEPTADDNVIIKSREATPKLLHTVLQVVRPDSFTASVIRRSSRSVSQSSLPSPCLWTSSQASPYTSASSSTSHRRSSLEVPTVTGGHPVAKLSLSESLQEEEEEEEFVIVETCKEPTSPASSCHSHHTTITLHHSSHPSSPVLQPASPCTSTSSHEEVFVLESAPEKPLKSQSHDGTLKEADNSTSKLSYLDAGQIHKSISPSQQQEEDLIQLSPVKESQAARKDSIEPDQATKSSQASECAASKVCLSSQERSRFTEAENIELANGFTSAPSSANHNRENSVRKQSFSSGSLMSRQTATRSLSSSSSSSHWRERTSSSTINTTNSSKNVTSQPNSAARDSGKETSHTQTPDISLSFPAPAQDGDSSSISSFWDQSTHSRSCKLQVETLVANTELLAEAIQSSPRSAANTEDLLAKFGLNHSAREGSALGCPSPRDSSTSPLSYELFLTELSKTMPNVRDQVPILSSSSLSLSSASSAWQQPILPSPPAPSQVVSPPTSLSPYQISCSAIVHRECISPDTSPFDAQESKL
ncbi:cyclic nucleotide-gated cation channel beta-1-like isoform X2 [Portunus trituberculatus]|uniref:cyclic nucleotide-gated cation channel beta-1-like isoform X2 n=1 Tax=Portunus trituberculatus TaxID=210409 RepID=UPI001E1CFFF2|nr:cyclic nucleotide-gated cation channel beta-1-like isoform X2 [Portunus trituberculatus]